MNISRLVLALFLVACVPAWQSSPAQAQPGRLPSKQQPGKNGTVEDFSGMYRFLEEGEFVQINLEEGRVTGFISRYGDTESDKGAFLDQFIKKGSLDGNKLDFVTDPLHGVWFEFKGSVIRGMAKAPGDDGYFVLKGKLIQYSTDANKKTLARSREVELKSFPQDAGVEKPKRN